MNQTHAALAEKSCLDGLWVVLVQNGQETEPEATQEQTPVMARAGNEQTYLLGFKNVVSARKFVESSELADAEPRMVVAANKDGLMKVAKENSVAGVLVDYDPATQEYASASNLF